MNRTWNGLKMPLTRIKNPLIVIVGPTAVGKTDLAIDLAEQLDGEIISADSRLFYRGMDIGTAKPTREQMMKVQHHLVDIANPDQIVSLAEYQKLAIEKIEEIHNKNKLPFLVGGTGQYVRALTEGWEIPHQPPNQKLRDAIQKWSNAIGGLELHHRLQLIDPIAASFIDPTNIRRTIRALEVIFGTGRKFSELRKKSGVKYSLLIIGLNRSREQLYQRIDDRIEKMITGGFLQEVKKLIKKGYMLDLPTMSAIGYKEIGEYLEGSRTLDEAILEMKRRTRIFVRRQANWFKETDPAIHWFNMEPSPKDEIFKLIASDAAWEKNNGE